MMSHFNIPASGSLFVGWLVGSLNQLASWYIARMTEKV